MAVSLVPTLLTIALLAMAGSVWASSFEFAGLSRATTPEDVAKRYPNSTVSSAYVQVSPKDTHDHIFGIELFGLKLSNRLRINFESPERKFPLCQTIEKSIVLRHGPPAEIREFNEEAMRNLYLAWKLELETVHLQCFKSGGHESYFAEAIAVYPTEPKVDMDAHKKDVHRSP